MTMVIYLVLIMTGHSTMLLSKDKMADFTLQSYDSKEHSLASYQDAKAIVLMFIATQCPVSNSYNQRMVKLFNDYQPQDVAFLAINANKAEDLNEIKKHAQQQGFEFPVLKDANNMIANRFGATVTPEIYVLSPELMLLYHGRIDDSQRESEVKSRDLRNALDEILQGKPVTVVQTKAFGCTIKKVD